MARDSFLSCNIKFIDHPDAQDLRIVDDLTWKIGDEDSELFPLGNATNLF